MASIALSRNKNDVTETTAQIKTTLSGFSLPSNTNTTKYTLDKQYYTVSSVPSGIIWNVSNNTINISGLDEGKDYNITISYKIEYTIDYYEWQTSEDGKGGSYVWVDSDAKTRSASNTIDIYTHPGSFSMGATSDSNSSNNIITNILTKEKIDEWIQHYQKAYHWHNQNNTNYSVDLNITRDETIKATWFNKCMIAMNVFDNKNYKTDYKGGINGDLITAAAINQMNFSGI